MIKQERFDLIMNALTLKKTATISFLSEVVGVSESTIRRDLEELEVLNKLNRVHGGAVLVSSHYTNVEDELVAKIDKNIYQKELIASYASKFIENNDFVFIDAGSTTALMVDKLTNTSAFYVTNGINVALSLSTKGFNVMILPGLVKNVTQAIVGIETINALRTMNFTKCFIGANGISSTRGYTTPRNDEALIKKEVMKNSSKIFVLADSSKFEIVNSITFSDLKNTTLITDNCPNKDYLNLANIIEVKE